MKSTLLKTLAAASLVATTHAEIHVLGASWKERGVNAPLGTIIPNPGTVMATRAYLIMDDTVTNATPNAATYIEYGEIRGGGVIDRYYTIDTDFTAFLADEISGSSSGARIYGHMHVPVTIADVTNPMISFSGTTFSTDFPRKLSFDHTVFQTGASDTATGPRIVLEGSTLRSVISGGANPVKVKATTISGAADELLLRLARQGYRRNLVEAPTIVTNLDATLELTDGEQDDLSVEVSSDVIPGTVPGSDPPESDDFAGPTYQWFKDDVAIPGAVGSSLTVTGGVSTATNGSGNYKVVVTNEFGSVTSVTTVVSAESPTFASDLPPTATLTGAGATTLGVTLSPTPVPTPTYQWLKSPTGAAGSFVNVAANVGGNDAKLTVIGLEAATGAGHYRLDVTTTAGTISSSVCIVTVNAAATNFVFTTNLPRTQAVAFAGTANLAPVVNGSANPAVDSRQWFKAPLGTTNFTAIDAGDGGNGITFTVSGNNANVNGPGVYRMVATSTGATPQIITTIDCTVTTAP